MPTISRFEVQKNDLAQTRMVSIDAPALTDGEVLVKIDSFAFTANNITYGVVGERIGYWKFFPTQDEAVWGQIPVWGFADIVESRHPDIPVGERLYGYFPMADYLVMQPDRIKPMRFVDGAPHRAELPPVYNSYARVKAEPGYDGAMDHERILLFPLYATSYCLYDFLVDNDWFGAGRENNGQIIIPSASSKTAIGLGFAIADDDTAPDQLGITSSGNIGMVENVNLYTDVISYSDFSTIDATRPSVIIDMSGNGTVLNDLHKHLGDNMRYTSNVGLTHYDDNKMGPDFIRERSAMFFAPGHIQKRTKEWGPGIFEMKALEFWKNTATRSRDWLSITVADGLSAAPDIYQEALAGHVPPSEGRVISV